MIRHVVWDWNGTLFADQHLVLESLNAVLTDARLPEIDQEIYQRHYTRPVQVFYEQLFGRKIPADEWQRLDGVYHATYRAALGRAGLADEAHRVLDTVAQTGRTQSLLSMWRHHELLDLVTRLGIADQFGQVEGLRAHGGGVKAPHLAAHLRRLGVNSGLRPAEVLVIGDALDDAAAAAHVGAQCVLYDGGSHPHEHLADAGVPIAASLMEALQIAGVEPH